ncbi:hypothetical protein SAMN05421664_0145 [Chryseobacterium soldanellicola]|uniref:Uncharacterized protein n=1 Tax=Chryseobacterium soldanellicola TaxID=311333 RepID=A0A1H0XQ77_9FLAO|nr:hypothetical protein SAMN05421664_0145 [Chryseobacterium soldanellicola]
MKIYALIQTISITIIFALRIFYADSTINVSHNLNLLFNSNINTGDAKSFVYFYLMLSMILSYLIFHKHWIFKAIYCLLICINILLIVFSLKQF